MSNPRKSVSLRGWWRLLLVAGVIYASVIAVFGYLDLASTQTPQSYESFREEQSLRILAAREAIPPYEDIRQRYDIEGRMSNDSIIEALSAEEHREIEFEYARYNESRSSTMRAVALKYIATAIVPIALLALILGCSPWIARGFRQGA